MHLSNSFIDYIKIDVRQPSSDQSGAAEAWWAHNPQVPGSKPGSDKFIFSWRVFPTFYKSQRVSTANLSLYLRQGHLRLLQTWSFASLTESRRAFKSISFPEREKACRGRRSFPSKTHSKTLKLEISPLSHRRRKQQTIDDVGAQACSGELLQKDHRGHQGSRHRRQLRLLLLGLLYAGHGLQPRGPRRPSPPL